MILIPTGKLDLEAGAFPPPSASNFLNGLFALSLVFHPSGLFPSGRRSFCSDVW